MVVWNGIPNKKALKKKVVKKSVKKVDKNKKAVKKVKKVIKSIEKDRNEYKKIRDMIVKYCEDNKEEYYILKGSVYNVDLFVFKRLTKIVKTIFDANPFMPHERCQHEQFIIPIFVSINKESNLFNCFNEEVKDFGCHFITIKSIDEIDRKLQEIN